MALPQRVSKRSAKRFAKFQSRTIRDATTWPSGANGRSRDKMTTSSSTTMEGMAELAGVSNTRDVEVRAMPFQKRHQLGRGSISEAENHAMIDLARGRVPGDPAEACLISLRCRSRRYRSVPYRIRCESGHQPDGSGAVMGPCGFQIWFYQNVAERSCRRERR